MATAPPIYLWPESPVSGHRYFLIEEKSHSGGGTTQVPIINPGEG